MSKMTDKMSEASATTGQGDAGVGSPKKGDCYRCSGCGMEVQVTADCHCKQGQGAHFHCCGQELQKV